MGRNNATFKRHENVKVELKKCTNEKKESEMV